MWYFPTLLLMPEVNVCCAVIKFPSQAADNTINALWLSDHSSPSHRLRFKSCCHGKLITYIPVFMDFWRLAMWSIDPWTNSHSFRVRILKYLIVSDWRDGSLLSFVGSCQPVQCMYVPFSCGGLAEGNIPVFSPPYSNNGLSSLDAGSYAQESHCWYTYWFWRYPNLFQARRIINPLTNRGEIMTVKGSSRSMLEVDLYHGSIEQSLARPFK